MEEHATLSTLAKPEHTALLIIDVQQWFTRERPQPMFPPIDDMLTCLGHLVEQARAVGVLVVRIQAVIPDEIYSEVWRRQFQTSWGSSSPLGPNEWGTAFAPGFEPLPGDLVVAKPRYSAFFGTSLETHLRNRGIQTVLVAGLTTDVCVSTTARDAFQRELNVITLSDCTADKTQARHESALATLANNFGMVCSAAELLATWQTEAAPLVAS